MIKCLEQSGYVQNSDYFIQYTGVFDGRDNLNLNFLPPPQAVVAVAIVAPIDASMRQYIKQSNKSTTHLHIESNLQRKTVKDASRVQRRCYMCVL